ncbi:Major Facilitator Superfamily [Geosmithia morbida]|uniref:Major Facilitator Superfamily n=1 Tax=Geosmithia morbida TaxID=1094350 RepID=A0A9P4YXB1_9HYPO|nr:Major Facilitator Superfamily [Geosmithia morbida]KAF4124227.1 Major Facilitator Superfamily [Geosmithia morbida]
MTATASSSASTNSTTAPGDQESQRISAPTKVTYLRRLTDQAGVTEAVLNHKYAGHGTEESPYLVEFVEDDPYNGMNMSLSRKWFITVVQALATLSVAFASSAYSGGVSEVIVEFGISKEVSILGVSMFVLGFAIGPLLWAPLSETYGRQKTFFVTYMALTAFNAGTAGAENIETLILLRFFAGAFGSSPLTNSGGVIADIFGPNQIGQATGVFAMAPFLGPSIGPIAGGFLGEHAGWRWVEGMIAIFTGVMWIVNTVCYPETYAPVLLQRRAAELSSRTGQVYVSKLEAGMPRKTVADRFRLALSRPLVLLFTEPIVLLLSIYMAIIYGTLYLCFAAFPIVFQQVRGWSPGIGGLAFIGLAVGMTIATLSTTVDNNKRYARVAAAAGGAAPPEARLPPAIVGSFLIPVGMFWFAWTNGPDIHWAVSIVGSAVFGGGIVLVFLSLMTYMIDSYVIYAASVLAANSVLRSLFGCAFPLFTTYMYEDLGIHWASSIPAFLAVACIPCPFLFYRYGPAIRARCKYTAEAAALLKQMRSRRAPPGESETLAEVEMVRTQSNAHVAH